MRPPDVHGMDLSQFTRPPGMPPGPPPGPMVTPDGFVMAACAQIEQTGALSVIVVGPDRRVLLSDAQMEKIAERAAELVLAGLTKHVKRKLAAA